MSNSLKANERLIIANTKGHIIRYAGARMVSIDRATAEILINGAAVAFAKGETLATVTTMAETIFKTHREMVLEDSDRYSKNKKSNEAILRGDGDGI